MLSIDEINKLKEENAKLNAIIDSYQPRLKDLQTRKDRYYIKTLEQERQISDYITILQEIKEIAEREYSKRLIEKDCFDCDASLWLIIDLITKPEEE